MRDRIQIEHYNNFKECFPTPPDQPAVGDNPQEYLARLNVLCNENLEWPENHPKGKLNRGQLRTLCRDLKVDVLIIYAAVMAWGGRGVKSNNYELSLGKTSQKKLVSALTTIREDESTREEAFYIFQEAAKGIKGLGISFFTKLLFFLRKSEDAYILDQFTAKSAKLLFVKPPIRLTSQGFPQANTTPQEYEHFCNMVEQLSCVMQRSDINWTAEKVEQAMFDNRSGDWRKYLRTHFYKKKNIRSVNSKLNSNERATEKENQMRLLAKAIVQVHEQYLKTGEFELPPLNGSIAMNPLRIHCCSCDGIIWQYSIQQKSVHAHVFIPNKYKMRYDRLCEDLNVYNGDFRDGIIGNDPKEDGKTRSIKLTLQIPRIYENDVINSYANKAVRNMAILLSRIGEHI